jgi:ribonuclease P protein component
MSQRFTWKKAEKLKSRKRIDRVFREGKSFSLFPYRVYFLLGPAVEASVSSSGATLPPLTGPMPSPPAGATPPRAKGVSPSPLQAGFGASSRHFKKAVDRNRIKRLSREAYRLQKQALLQRVKEKGVSMALFFIYTGKDLPDYATASEKIGVALQKLIKEIT